MRGSEGLVSPPPILVRGCRMVDYPEREITVRDDVRSLLLPENNLFKRSRRSHGSGDRQPSLLSRVSIAGGVPALDSKDGCRSWASIRTTASSAHGTDQRRAGGGQSHWETVHQENGATESDTAPIAPSLWSWWSQLHRREECLRQALNLSPSCHRSLAVPLQSYWLRHHPSLSSSIAQKMRWWSMLRRLGFHQPDWWNLCSLPRPGSRSNL